MLEIDTYKIEEVSSMITPNPVTNKERKHTLTKEVEGIVLALSPR